MSFPRYSKVKQKMKKLQIAIMAASLAFALNASADITYDNAITPIVGSGNTSGGWTTATDNGLALSLRSQYNNTPLAVSANPTDFTPNNGAGTFTFPVGTTTLATWDFWFDVNPGETATTGDTFILTINGTPVPFSLNAIPDNGHAGTEFQNAEDIGFGGANPSLNATYNFTLTAYDGNGNSLDSVDMTVINGAAPVPEPKTIISGAMLLLPFGMGAVRFFRKQRTI
jgi:hypothetical protein